MRKITQNLLLLTAVSLLVLTSCGEDEETLPNVPSVTLSASVDGTAISSGDEVEVGTVITFTADIIAAGGVNTLWIGNDPVSRAELNVTAGATTASYSFTSSVDQEGNLSLEVYAVDDAAQESSRVTFSILGVITSPPAKVQTAIILAAPDADGNNTAFYSVDQNLLYSHNDVVGTAEAVSQNIDLAYYFGDTDEASLVSPSEYPAAVFDISAWTVRNETAMVQVVDFTNEEFMALTTVADVEAVLESVSDETAVLGFTGVEVGTVVAFETASGTAGVLRVQDLTTGFSGSIELEMILAEAAE